MSFPLRGPMMLTLALMGATRPGSVVCPTLPRSAEAVTLRGMSSPHRVVRVVS